MHSREPKVLHDLCGLPMVLWPVRAAQAAGAGRVVVVDSPERSLEHVLPAQAQLAVQPRPDGTGGAVAAAIAQLDAGGAQNDAPVVVLSGDVPLVGAPAIESLVRAHEESAAQATMASTMLDNPSGYGRVVRHGDGSFERVVETKAGGDASAQELAIHEVNTGIYVFSGQALRATLPRPDCR